jgi:hypothetical protein
MTAAVNVVHVPVLVPVPVANGMGSERWQPPPPYPTERRDRQPRHAIPVQDQHVGQAHDRRCQANARGGPRVAIAAGA